MSDKRKTIISRFKFLAGLVAVAGVVVAVATYTGTVTAPISGKNASIVQKDVEVASDGNLKLFDSADRYVMEDFDAKPTFASFLPAVAGVYGKPVWSFYVHPVWCPRVISLA